MGRFLPVQTAWKVAALGLVAASQSASARSIVDFPLDIRQKNFVRLSTLECEECVTWDAFLKKNPIVFVLFFERSLARVNNYKKTIISGFFEVCEALRFSRIACGAVDLVTDKDYMTPYVDVKTIPAHIIFGNGEPVGMEKHHVDALMKKPGDKDTILWHLQDILAPKEPRSAFDISTEIHAPLAKKALPKLLQRHRVVVVAAVEGEEATDLVRAAAQHVVMLGKVAGQVQSAETPSKSPPKKGLDGWRRARERSRVAFIAFDDRKAWKAHNLKEGSVIAFLDGEPLKTQVKLRLDKLDESQVAKAFQEVALPALKAAASQATTADAAAGTPPSLSGARKGRGGSEL